MKKNTLGILLIVLLFACQKQIDYQPQITALQKSRDSLATALSQTNLNLNSANNNIASISKVIDSIKSQLNVINIQISSLKTQINSINTNITILQAQIADLQFKITELTKLLDNYINSVSDIDGNIYFTTLIGNQRWTTSNLNVSRYKNGDSIPEVTDKSKWANSTTGAFCYYNNDESYGKKIGKNYNWLSINDKRGLAPNGWHVATDEDWNILLKYIDPATNLTSAGVDQSALAGGPLKDTSKLFWKSPNVGATDFFGFKILAAGGRDYNGDFESNFGYETVFWTSTIQSDRPEFAWTRLFHHYSTGVFRNPYTKSGGLSIRLVKD
jgi:uncharacterized protein (TIGR02145 family)